MSDLDPTLKKQRLQMSIEDVHVFNEHLRSIAQSDIPIDLGTVDGLPVNATTISRMGSSVLQRIQHPVKNASLHDAPSTPSLYEQSLVTWARDRNAVGALVPLVLLGECRRSAFKSISASFIEPFILLILAYLGTLYLQATLLPRFENLYDQLGVTPGPIFSFLQWMRSSTLAWSLIMFLSIALLYWAGKSAKTILSLRWLPQQVHQMDLVHKSIRASALAHVLEHPTDSTPEAYVADAQLTPLMRWALQSGESKLQQSRAMRFVQCLYQEFPEQTGIRWRYWTSVILSTLLGGILVLAFGFSVFGPVIEMLYVLVSPEY